MTTTNRRGDPISYTYNTAGQITTKTYSDGTQDTYSYAAHGNLIQTTDPTGTTKYDYDVDDRLIKITDPSGRYLRFTYNTAGQRTSSIDQLGYELDYHYDPLGRLASITEGSGAMIVSYGYDADGRLARKDMGNGTYTTYDYFPDGHISHLINYAAGGTILSRFDYAYDSRGRETSMTTLQGTWLYSYDDLGQLIGWTAPDGSSATYQYDAMGNRVQVIQNGQTTSYTTNNLNQYTTVGGVTYTYDADGNLIRKASGSDATTYSYDPENRLIAVTHGTDVQTYMYDALDNRVRSTENGSVAQYMIDPIGLGDVVGQYDGSANLVTRYNYGFGLVSQVDPTGNSYFYNFSATGNTSELTNAAGASVNSYVYDPFGISLGKTETLANPFQYVGEFGVTNEREGMEFMRARFYATTEGRFVQQDPIGINGGLNLVAYSQNNPTSHVDPSGLNATGDVCEISSIAWHLLELLGEWYRTWPNLDQWRRDYQDRLKQTDPGEPDPLPNLPPFPGPHVTATQHPGDGNFQGGPGGSGGPGSPGGGCCGSGGGSSPSGGASPSGGGSEGGGGSSSSAASGDPNSLIGPAGFGPAGFIAPDQRVPLSHQLRERTDGHRTRPAG